MQLFKFIKENNLAIVLIYLYFLFAIKSYIYSLIEIRGSSHHSYSSSLFSYVTETGIWMKDWELSSLIKCSGNVSFAS